jgi:hypothetical protein
VVQRRQPGVRVDHEQDEVGLLDRDARLVLDPLLDVRARLELEAAGVDEGEAAPIPLRRAVHPVARRPGHVLDDREARADEPVEERALPDVRATDDGHDGQGGHRPSVAGGRARPATADRIGA